MDSEQGLLRLVVKCDAGSFSSSLMSRSNVRVSARQGSGVYGCRGGVHGDGDRKSKREYGPNAEDEKSDHG
jgi:hypothetical protein